MFLSRIMETTVKSTNYLVIMPVRNEEQYLEKTLESLVQQSILPVELIVVDDASWDKTKDIVKKFQAGNDWITLYTLPDRQELPTWQAVLNAFDYGYSRRKNPEPDYLVKLDGDLEFPPNFFEKCFSEFERNPKLGVTGGLLQVPVNGNWQVERVPTYHVRGATKVYRWQCWQDVGGFAYRHGWDGIDLIQAQMHGWETYHLKDNIVLHFRPSGKRQGVFETRAMLGQTYHYLGSSPFFVLFAGIKRMFSQPFLVGGCAVIIGYLKSVIHKEARIDDPDLVNFYRQQQLKRMTFGLFDRKR